MGDFFCGWRCKSGCVALVMAMLSASAWMRSPVGDAVAFVFSGREHFLVSLDGQFLWFAHKNEEGEIGWDSGFSKDDVEEFVSDLADDPESALVEWSLPYWPFAPTLTMLSAYLLLWPRKRP